MLGNLGSFPVQVNIRFAVALSNLSRNLSRNVKKYDFSIAWDVTHAFNDHSIKTAIATESRIWAALQNSYLKSVVYRLSVPAALKY